jgi:hypothetical protein
VKLVALVLAVAAATPLTVLPRPRFNAPAQAPTASRVHFVVVSSRLHAITAPNEPQLPPRTFRGASLQRVANGLEIYSADGASGRYVVGKTYAFDFGKYAWPPRYVPSDKEFVYEEVVWAQEMPTGVLYVETAHDTYASSSFGLNGYLNAIELKTRKLVWRSPALVANAADFVVLDDVIVSGYGFTDEPDYLYAVSRTNGHLLGRLLLPNAPERIVRRGDTLDVRTYDHDLVVKLST